jgi:hypothetical protein
MCLSGSLPAQWTTKHVINHHVETNLTPTDNRTPSNTRVLLYFSIAAESGPGPDLSEEDIDESQLEDHKANLSMKLSWRRLQVYVNNLVTKAET